MDKWEDKVYHATRRIEELELELDLIKGERMETIVVNGKTYYSEKPTESGAKGDRAHTFLTIGKIYCFRTVTMIYTGRLVAVSEQEYLIEDAAWIAETERWADFLKTGAHKEAEPYCAPVAINRGALLDTTLFPILIKDQK